ncbi:hypothetical protein DSM112329_05033 [Paraconexibacter sp. AEG42_29]|uniref:Flippase-like domain-containing protein n=1 Tax=Paraconexibacter sp. AEG42_29 TaxID=2997339 RepID=A0AAU7B3F4_9ACTN
MATSTDTSTLPAELDLRRLGRRALQVIAVLVLLGLAAMLTPGLGELRAKLDDAIWGWLVVAVVLEGLSGMSYVLMFRPVFCRLMSFRSAMEISWSELGMGSLVPASGIGGLALGAWVLTRDGMSAEHVAERSVAFFLIKSSVNFVAVAVLGVIMFAGVGPSESVWLTLLPAAMSVALIAAILSVPRFGPGRVPGDGAGRVRRAVAKGRAALIEGTAAAIVIVRRGDPLLIIGAIGYWAFDNAVLWATLHAFDVDVPLTVVLMGYLIGQLGGLLPIPGGIGGIDGGLIGTLIVYGAPAAGTAAAVLAYRVILFWLPLLAGAVAFVSLKRAIDHPGRPDLCREATTEGAEREAARRGVTA